MKKMPTNQWCNEWTQNGLSQLPRGARTSRRIKMPHFYALNIANCHEGFYDVLNQPDDKSRFREYRLDLSV